MDPLPAPPAVPVDLAALLGQIAAPREAQLRAALLALVGRELDVLFEATVPEGVKLRLPQGQILVADGHLPYPEGTVLRVQVLPPLPGETAPRLQPLSAQLPPPPALLAPLVQGEALPLLQRLQAPDPPLPLRALASLYQFLDALEPPTDSGPPVPASPRPLPEIPAALREPLTRALVRVLPPESPEALVTRWLAAGKEGAASERPADPPARVPAPPPEARWAERILQDPTLAPRVRELLAALREAPRAPASLPPEWRVPLGEALSPRLPPPSVETLLRRWVAQVNAAPPAPVSGPTPAPSESPLPNPPGLLPTPSADLTPTRQEPLALWLNQAPAALRAIWVPLLRDLALLSPAPPQPPGLPDAPPGRPAVPTPLLARLAALPPAEWEGLARSVGLAPGRPLPEVAQALLDSARVGTSALPGLPEALVQALPEAAALPGPAPTPSPVSPLRALPLPPPEALERLLASWPESRRVALSQALTQALAQTLPSPPASAPVQAPALPVTPRDLAEALVRWLQSLEPPPTLPGTAPAAESPAPPPRVAWPRGLPPEAEKLLNHPALAAGLKEGARTWLKALFAPALETALRPPPGKAAPPPSLAELPLNPETKAGLEARLALAAPDTLAHSEPWAGWVEASLNTLADPQVSPREAPFHALQALDGTAYFEIPLPGRASGPLQLWVEQGASAEAPDAPPVHKVLLGLRFTALGETRVGLMQAAGALSVRIWAENPAPLWRGEAALQAQLEALGDRVSLRLAILPQGSPTPRSLVMGPGYQGLA